MKNMIVKSKELIIMVGLPGSGKTTYINNVLLKSGKKYTICSTDDLIEAKAKELSIGYEEAFKLYSNKETERAFKEMIWSAIDNGDNIIIDRTNLTLKGRAKMISYFDQRKANDYIKKAVLFDMGDINKIRAQCRQRELLTGKHISDVNFVSMILRYEPPTMNEFDEIIII